MISRLSLRTLLGLVLAAPGFSARISTPGVAAFVADLAKGPPTMRLTFEVQLMTQRLAGKP